MRSFLLNIHYAIVEENKLYVTRNCHVFISHLFKVFRPSALRLLNAAIEITIQHMFQVFQFSGLHHFSAAAEITIRVARQVNLNKKKCTYIPHVWQNGVCGSLLGDLTINILAPTYYFTNQHDSPLVQVYDFEANR